MIMKRFVLFLFPRVKHTKPVTLCRNIRTFVRRFEPFKGTNDQ
jgi:hypothetical protein